MGVSCPMKLALFLALVILGITTQEGSSTNVFRFTKRAPSVIIARYKQKIEIDCSTNDPKATTVLYRRKRSKKKIGINTPVRTRPRNGSIYTLTNIKSRDSGFYRCEATSPGGTTIKWDKHCGRLFVLGLPNSSRRKRVDVGKDVVFKCSGPLGTVIQWQNIPNHATETTKTRRAWTKSSLKLKKVQAKDGRRTISCSTTFRGVIRRLTFQLHVIVPIPCEPVLNKNVRTVFHPMLDQSVEMTCEVERCMYPPPTFKWEMQWWPCSISHFDPDCEPRHRQWIKTVPGKIKNSGRRSTLLLPKYMQLGFFQCTASNSIGGRSIVYKLIGRLPFSSRVGASKKKER